MQIVPESGGLAQFIQHFDLNEPGDHHNYMFITRENDFKYFGITSEIYNRLSTHEYFDKQNDSAIILTVSKFRKDDRKTINLEMVNLKTKILSEIYTFKILEKYILDVLPDRHSITI